MSLYFAIGIILIVCDVIAGKTAYSITQRNREYNKKMNEIHKQTDDVNKIIIGFSMVLGVFDTIIEFILYGPATICITAGTVLAVNQYM